MYLLFQFAILSLEFLEFDFSEGQLTGGALILLYQQNPAKQVEMHEEAKDKRMQLKPFFGSFL